MRHAGHLPQNCIKCLVGGGLSQSHACVDRIKCGVYDALPHQCNVLHLVGDTQKLQNSLSNLEKKSYALHPDDNK